MPYRGSAPAVSRNPKTIAASLITLAALGAFGVSDMSGNILFRVFEDGRQQEVKCVGWGWSDAGEQAAAGSGKVFTVPRDTDLATMSGLTLISVEAQATVAGTTNPTVVQLYNHTQGVEMLSSPLSLASGDTVETGATIDTSNDQLYGGDLIYPEVPSVSDTPPEGLSLKFCFKPQ